MRPEALLVAIDDVEIPLLGGRALQRRHVTASIWLLSTCAAVLEWCADSGGLMCGS